MHYSGLRSVSAGQDLSALTSKTGKLVMRNIAIIGSGQAGLLAAHGLINAGYKVTLYSDRTADQWLNESRPTGTAARFDISVIVPSLLVQCDTGKRKIFLSWQCCR